MSVINTLSLNHKIRITLSIPCDWLPTHLHILLPRSCERNLMWDFADVMKDSEVGSDPGWSGWARCHHRALVRDG